MALFSHSANDHHEAVHLFDDADSGLRCIIAIHSTHLGPAVGGCRVWHYDSEDDALADALRLSRGMTYKNALVGLRIGGGKAVILTPRSSVDRGRLFTAFGKVVECLGGRYITAEDVGSTVQDMQTVAMQTQHVAGLPTNLPSAAGGDPSPWTALGVFLAVQTAVEHRLGRSLEGLRVAVQGSGNVGHHLCKLLFEAGAQLLVADTLGARADRTANAFNAIITPVDAIHAVDADVFCPCALGGVVNARTIDSLKAKVICGAANNQLAVPDDGQRLTDRDILYCPDYVVNAGGIINVMAEHNRRDVDFVRQQVREIPRRLSEVIARAAAERCATNVIADAMAREIVARG